MKKGIVLFSIIMLLFSIAIIVSPASALTDEHGNAVAEDQDNGDGLISATQQRCFYVTNSYNVQFYIEAWKGGSISGSICDAPNWLVTAVSYNSSTQTGTLTAVHTGSGSCASSVVFTVSNNGQSWSGQYCWNGSSATCYPATATPISCNAF